MPLSKKIRDWFNRPFYLDRLFNYLPDRRPVILDVGCGTHSASIIKKFLPEAEYHGIDKDTSYLISEADLALMKRFYEINLASPSALDQIPKNHFSLIIMSHVLEHIHTGEEVILKLSECLRKDGLMYLEFPSLHSVKLPSIGKGTLNFHDDPTHVTLHDYRKLAELLKKNGFVVLESGIRRGWKRILFLWLYQLRSIISGEGLRSSHFYDITGFASYVLAKKTTI